MKNANYLDPNPMLDGPIGFKCVLTPTMKENFFDVDFNEFVLAHLPGAIVIDSDTGYVHFDAKHLPSLREAYQHFFGSTF